jgi:hypothetical protein
MPVSQKFHFITTKQHNRQLSKSGLQYSSLVRTLEAPKLQENILKRKEVE